MAEDDAKEESERAEVSELRDKAERLLIAYECMQRIVPSMDKDDMMNGIADILRAFLAERLEDDESEADYEWFLKEGFLVTDAHAHYVSKRFGDVEVIYIHKGRWLRLAVNSGSKCAVADLQMGPARGDVRRLCNALTHLGAP